MNRRVSSSDKPLFSWGLGMGAFFVLCGGGAVEGWERGGGHSREGGVCRYLFVQIWSSLLTPLSFLWGVGWEGYREGRYVTFSTCPSYLPSLSLSLNPSQFLKERGWKFYREGRFKTRFQTAPLHVPTQLHFILWSDPLSPPLSVVIGGRMRGFQRGKNQHTFSNWPLFVSPQLYFLFTVAALTTGPFCFRYDF